VSGRPIYFLSLFAGIGGFDLAAYWAGLRFDGHYFSEVNDYSIQIYKRRFPEALELGDISKVDWKELCKELNKEEPAQVLVTGGFP
jgi:site-specific DNA-cytosine methylase